MVRSITKISVPGFLANGISVGIKGSDQKRPCLNLFCHTRESGGRIY